jgi:hypothetical protein
MGDVMMGGVELAFSSVRVERKAYLYLSVDRASVP